MSPLSRKHNRIFHFSQPTPGAAKTYLLQKPQACLLKHSEKLWSMCHLFASIDYFPIHREPLAYSMDILFFSIFPRTWSFMTLLLFNAPQGVLTCFWGRCLLHHLSSYLAVFLFVISPCGSTNTLLTATYVLIPLIYLIK